MPTTTELEQHTALPAKYLGICGQRHGICRRSSNSFHVPQQKKIDEVLVKIWFDTTTGLLLVAEADESMTEAESFYSTMLLKHLPWIAKLPCNASQALLIFKRLLH